MSQEWGKKDRKKTEKPERQDSSLSQWTNIEITEYQKKMRQMAECIFEEIMVEQFFKLMKDKNLHMQEAQGTLSRIIKETHVEIHYNQTVENKRQRKNLKAERSDGQVQGVLNKLYFLITME